MALFSAAAKGDVQKIQSLIDSEDKSEYSRRVNVNCSDTSGKTALHIASENGHLQTVKCLTNHGANVNVVDANLQTAVHLCSKKGHLHVVELLVNKGAGIEIGDKYGLTALHIASFKGHVDIVKYLVSEGAELERLANDYWTPLHLALDGGHLDIAEYLLKEGANINTCGTGGRTALHTASQTGNIDGVKYLTSQGAELNRITDDGWTALSLASFGGHLGIVKVLVNEGVDVDLALRNGMTPLCLATKRGHVGIVEVLLNVGANIDNCNQDGLTALHIASSNGHVEIVHHLVNKGAQLDKCDKNDRTPLYGASQKGHLEVVEYIVNKGAGIDIGDKDGFTALHKASMEGHLDIVKSLVRKGARLDKCDKTDRTPLSWASQEGHLEVVEYIVNKGAGVEIGDKDGLTALHLASFIGHLDIVKYLVSKGAGLERLADDNWTPLHLALDGGHLDIAEYLLKEGANINTCDKGGRTSLHTASHTGNIDEVKYLTSQGAELDWSTDDGWTALSLASFGGHLDVVKFLVNRGVEVDKALRSGMTPLCLATEEGHLGIVKVLLNVGANIDNCNQDGLTALHIASSNGHVEIVHHLVSKGADLRRLSNDNWTPSGLALNGCHLDIYEYLLDREATRIVEPFIGLDRKKYRGRRRRCKALHLSNMPLHSRSHDPVLTSLRDSSRSPMESITEETMVISLDEYSIKVPISPDDVDRAKNITAEALTRIPPELNLKKDEVIISVGLKLSPSGLQFKTPVEVKVLHSAIFINPHKAEIVLYTRRTVSDEFSRIVPASDKAARCVVAKNHLTLYLHHFSEWWIISIIKRYFIGKRLICTPYVPLSTYRDVLNLIYLVIKDDFCGMKEDTIRDYKVAFPGEQYCVYWGKGPLFVRHLENEVEVSNKELEECAFFDMTTHRMPFTLQPRDRIVSGVLVTFILKQKITKDIGFTVWYKDLPHEIEIAESTPTGTASSKGKAEPSDVARGTSKSSQLYEELTRSEHHDLETIGSTSSEPADTKDGSSHTDVFTRPRPLTPSSKESLPCEHAYQVTHAYHVTEPGAIAPTSSTVPDYSLESAAEEAMGVLAPQAFAANVVQPLVPGSLADPVHQRSGNVNIYVREMVINNPQGNNPHGNTVGSPPVAIASIVPPMLQHELRCRLNRESPVFDDWRGLANELGLGDYIQSLEQCKNPTEELLVLAESQKKIQNLGDLCKAFERMNRGDCQELCENYAFERTKSADLRKDQIEDDDTDISD